MSKYDKCGFEPAIAINDWRRFISRLCRKIIRPVTGEQYVGDPWRPLNRFDHSGTRFGAGPGDYSAISRGSVLAVPDGCIAWFIGAIMWWIGRFIFVAQTFLCHKSDDVP